MPEVRLIDANAAADKIMHNVEVHADEIGIGATAIMIAFARALRDETDFPTIEPEERHGRWIEKPPYADETVKGLEFQIVCSRCDEQNASINFNDDGEIIGKTFYKTKFCPNCGARMGDSVMMGDANNG